LMKVHGQLHALTNFHPGERAAVPSEYEEISDPELIWM
jgi:hypothetical protein